MVFIKIQGQAFFEVKKHYALSSPLRKLKITFNSSFAWEKVLQKPSFLEKGTINIEKILALTKQKYKCDFQVHHKNNQQGKLILQHENNNHNYQS